MICFPITHKQTVNKVIKLAYKKKWIYGIMMELMFSTGYRMCDVIKMKKSDIFNGKNVTLFLKEKKTGNRRYFKRSEIPTSFLQYVENGNPCVCHCYIFPSPIKNGNGKERHISASRVKQVFSEIFGSLSKLQGAKGTHIPRKTFAYIKYKEKDIYNAQIALGHTNINSTTKYLPESILRK